VLFLAGVPPSLVMDCCLGVFWVGWCPGSGGGGLRYCFSWSGVLS
jgi:hypothetical protein